MVNAASVKHDAALSNRLRRPVFGSMASAGPLGDVDNAKLSIKINRLGK
jgi:hypothetical protein